MTRHTRRHIVSGDGSARGRPQHGDPLLRRSVLIGHEDVERFGLGGKHGVGEQTRGRIGDVDGALNLGNGAEIDGSEAGDSCARRLRAGVRTERAARLGNAARVAGAGGGRHSAAARGHRPGDRDTRQRRAGIVAHDHRERFG